MSYNPNIPAITDQILQSAAQIRSNYRAINKAMNANHALLTGDVSLAGKHTFVILRPVTDPTTSASQVALYNKLVSSVPNLFFRPSSSQTTIQMTYPSVLTGDDGATPPVYLDRQQSFVAGPFVIYVGKLTFPISGTVITLTPASTLIYVSLVVTNAGAFGLTRVSAAATNISGNQFTVQLGPDPGLLFYDIYYTAIGKP